jgi:hypothetical protein
MFGPKKCFSPRPEWGGSLGRINRTLFLMVIDAASRTGSHNPSKPSFNITSNFIRPNQ